VTKGKVLLLPGWSSDGWRKAAFLRLMGYDVTTPRLSDWSFTKAVARAQAAFDLLQPDVVVGSSRAVAMNMDTGDTPLVLLAPAWRRWGTARSVKKNSVVIHSPQDDLVPFSDSVALCQASGVRLIVAGKDHRLNCPGAQQAVAQALRFSQEN
jgi:hypothetical protein